ncbi:MAG: glutamyl-tRNA reductase [Thermoplasmatota archaeon]
MDAVTLLTWRSPIADAAVLEHAALAGANLDLQLRATKERLGVSGLGYLATCQRVVWILQEAPADCQAKLLQSYADQGRADLPPPERREGFEAFRQLAEIASSLDSLVPGEPQVLGQVKQAVALCEEAGVLGPDLRHVFDLALRTAKAVRSQTSLFEGKVSLIPLAQDAMRDALKSQQNARAAIVGTGEMAMKAIELLRHIRPEAEIHVASRGRERARMVAERHAVVPHTLDAFLASPPPVQLLILAMEVEQPILSAAWLTRQAQAGPMTVLDLGLPRNAEAPMHLPQGLHLIQLDDLVALSEQAKTRREAAYEDAMGVLEDELDRVRQEYDARCHASTLFQLSQRFKAVSEERWLAAHPHLGRDDPWARKWYEQTVRALLHEATQAVKTSGGEVQR